MKNTYKLKDRILSLITAVVMVFTMLPQVPITAFAEETGTTECIHHIHSEECGYAAAVEEVLCTHTHDESCGYVVAVGEVKCECTDTDENGAVLHAENCGYILAVEEVPCTHTHDENCGYAPAVAGTPCTWTAESCAECNPADESADDGETVPAVDSTIDVPADETEPAVECICETDDDTVHAVNCPLYTSVENPQCFCGEKCTAETLNYWCDVCGVQGAQACKAAEEETAVTYTGYAYVDQYGTVHTVDNATEITENTTTWSDGWYYIGSHLIIPDRITVNGDVTLVLGINAYLEALKGIKVSGGNSLTIYGASATSGLLYAYSYLDNAAIGSDGRTIADANGNSQISPDADTTLGTITINSGRVHADGAAGDYSTAAAIGGGKYSKGGTININGGYVHAKSPSGISKRSPAIGPGEEASGDVTINITGGTVIAQANYTAIGNGTNDDCNLVLNISGGYIEASSHSTSSDAVTIGSWASSRNSVINITGGIIDAASIGSHLFKDVLTVSGGKFRQDPAASLPKGMYTVIGADYMYTTHWGGAYIEGVTQVESINVTVDGIVQTLAADDYKIVDGNLYIFVSNGAVVATVNGTIYTGNHTSAATKLAKHIKIDDLDISSDTINVGEPKEFTATVVTPGATAEKLEYKITDQGTTEAYIVRGATVQTKQVGVFRLTVTATDAFGLTYSETFEITSEFTPVTGISGDSNIPQTSEPAVIQLPVQVLPENASKTGINWSFADEDSKNYADIEGNTLYLIKKGTVNLRATVEGGLGNGVDFVKDYTISITEPTSINIGDGNITFSQNNDGTINVKYGASNSINIDADKIVAITGTTTNHRITISSGEPKIVLENCSITSGGGPAVDIKNGAKADITISGTNILKGECAIKVPDGAQLVIGGTGTLDAQSSSADYAAIGSGKNENSGSITINSGTISATSGENAAAIGGGYNGHNNGGITINGGTVTATNSSYGATIGGYRGKGSITINDGTVTVTNNSVGAAIGDGDYGAGSSITINGGIINATNNGGKAAIGGTNGSVIITDGHITATTSGYTAGIGGDNVAVSISGGTVIATGGRSSAGIGANDSKTCGTINISGGTVTATGGHMAAGIGSEEKGSVNIIISGGTVTATGGYMAAGIGNGYNNDNGGTITINGGTVTATGGSNGAGIGGGNYGNGCTVNISGGAVTARGGNAAAGIGGGNIGDSGDVNITGGTVVAAGGNAAAGIGGGYAGNGGNVVITGGNIKATAGNSYASAIGKGRESNDTLTDGTLTDGTNNVELRTITLNGAAADTAVTDAVLSQGASYGVKDVKTLDTDKLYFYLPATTTVNSITAGTAEYICNRNNTHYTAHGTTGYADINETTHDEMCTECNAVVEDNVPHEYGVDSKCDCGHTDHIHSWTYTADENTATITAKCTEDGCPLTNADGGSVKITVADGEYTGSAFEADVTNTLTTGATYTVAYTTKDGSALTGDKAVNVGKYTATLSVDEESISADFEITAKEITEGMVSLNASGLVYNGEEQKPVVTVDECTLNTDYTVEYSNNIKPTTETSKAKVTVTGKGNYTGTVDKTFEISKAEITAEIFTLTYPSNLVYDGNAKIVTATLKDGFTGVGNILVKYYDESNSLVSQAVNAGKYTVKLSIGEGENYTATQEPIFPTDGTSWSFEITKADYDMSNVKWNRTSSQPFEFDGTVHTVELTGLPQGVTASYTDNSKTAVGGYVAKAELSYDSENYNAPSAIEPLEWIIEWNVAENKDYTITSASTPNSDGWYNSTVTITPATGCLISTEKDGTYGDKLTLIEDTADGNVTFWLKDIATGSVSDEETVIYKLDATAPTGKVYFDERNSWEKLLNTISFDLFFKTEVTVKADATDSTSSVDTIEYAFADKALTESEIKAITAWTEMPNGGVAVTAEETEKFVYFVRITDKAGNVTYLSTNGAIYDFTAPVISDITDGEIYYTTQKFTVTESNLADVKVNSNTATDYILAGNVEATYIVVATDKAGNSATVTVTMKPISTLTETIKDLTEENVTAEKSEALAAAETALGAIDTTNATEAEKQLIKDAQDNIDKLQKVIEDTAAEVKALEDTLAGYNKDTVKSTDEAAVDQLIADITAKLEDTNLSAEQKTDLTEALADAQELADKIDADKAALEDANNSVPDVNTDNVTADNAQALKEAKEKLEDLKADDNYTEAEKAEIQEEIDRIEKLEEVIEETKKEVSDIEAEAGALDPDAVTSDDKDDIEQFIGKMTDKLDDANLTDEQKDRIGQAIDAAEEIIDKIAEDQKALEDAIDSVPTVDTDNATEEDIGNLESAKETLDKLLNDTNYTAEEKAEVQEKLDEIKDIANQIGSTYEIIHGADGKWTKGSSKTLGFTANGLFRLFKEVRVDDAAITKDVDYTAMSGSTIVTLNKSYLDTLSVGKHKLEVVYDVLGTEHIADCEFTVKAKPVESTPATTTTPTDNVPKTGDSTNTVGWMAMMLSSMAALAVVLKKKKEYEDR